MPIVGKRTLIFLISGMCIAQSGCLSNAPPRANPGVAPPLPTPSPLAPGVLPPSGTGVVRPATPAIPVPPGAAASPPASLPVSPQQDRVQVVANRLYQANPWLKIRPQWFVRPGDVPGVTNQGDHYALISEGLVNRASEGQLAAVMSLQLADMAAARQRAIIDVERRQRDIQPLPDFYQPREGMSSAQANLELAEMAKYRKDPHDLRRREQTEAPIEPPVFARQILTLAGFGPQELESAGPLLQQFPPVRPPGAR